MRQATNVTTLIGDRVKFWTRDTGLQPQLGTVQELRRAFGIPYAAISPDGAQGSLVYLCHRAVWGYELLDEEREWDTC
jgi:hypothetical protein